MKILAAAALLATVAPLAPGQGETSVIGTPHNLSASGPGPIRALDEDRVCIFCHTPHGSRSVAPLWNRNDSTATYLPYDSPTLDADPGQPTGASKLCLSCHDGTVALGQVVSQGWPIAMAGGVTTLPPGHGLIGTDLRDDHPFSFVPVEGDPEMAPTDEWSPLEVDANGELQCTTCHEPHSNTHGDFLILDNTEGAMCQICHRLPGWSLSSHATATFPGPTPLHVSEVPGGCGLCHRPHGAGSTPILNAVKEEQACLPCHSQPTGRTANIQAAMRQPFGHFGDRTQGEHAANESPAEARDHAECVDCHNPHRSNDRPSLMTGEVGGALEGVPGVTLNGFEVEEARFEYEVCLRCHSGYQASPRSRSVRRDRDQHDLAREFDPGNPSYHPVAAPGRSAHVPSLLPPLTEGSQIRCSDCHRGEPGAAPGPHGSRHEWILGGEHRVGDGIAESPRAYELCYQCHSRASILANESFPGHRRHIVDEKTSCAVCHDPHGISFTQGDPMEHAHLINFDIDVVQPDPTSGRLAFMDLGEQAGQCFLTCHGVVHSPLGY